MGSFGLKRYDEYDGGHYFSILSPTDLSVSENLELPFDKNDNVDGGSCGDVVYFYSHKGKTVIFNLETKEFVVVPPPEVLARPMKRGEYTVFAGEYMGCGVSYDAKSRDYQVIRIYTEEVQTEREFVTNYCYDLYSVLSGSAKEITGPSRKCRIKWHGTSTYVGEAGSGSGSCYWVAWPFEDDYSSDDPLVHHVLAFDFATERFDQFPMPAWAKGASGLEFELVECRGSLGVLVHWFRPDEFSIEGRWCDDLSVRLFVRNVNGKAGTTSWELLYDVTIADVERPIGLKDGRVLFLAARPSGGQQHQLMMAYYLASKTRNSTQFPRGLSN